LIVGWAFALRAAAAVAVQRYVDGKGTLCVFADTQVYWMLAGAIGEGKPYVVSQWGVPHYALRTPGYPLFLAACRGAFGDHLLPVRLVQAALGAGCVWLLDRLVGAIKSEEAGREGWTAPKIAAAWAATDPYVVGMSALVLSEALFLPLMVGSLWGMAAVWNGSRRRGPLALATGAATGAAILVRPSWAAFVPVMLLAWVATARRGDRAAAARGAMLVALGTAVVLAPWWIRNARTLGRFVPTALWVGASLYDGLSPEATGASDMRFLDDPQVRALDEPTQDAELRRQALDFAREHPRRALQLAAIKAARFWSPGPNADMLKRPGVAWAGALVTIPFYALLLVGIYDRRRDARALTLLLGPLLAFAALHMVFVSSIRYRIPGAVPAFGLAAIGLRKVLPRAAGSTSSP
jgi:hypothetical protein